MFSKAVRRKAKLKLAIIGPSGSGKTMSALRLAKGLGGKIAVIDCENDSASLYAHLFDFDSMNMTPPFTTEKYAQAIEEAAKLKYDVLIIDTISHAWAGTGGLKEQKDKLDSSGKGSSYTNWGPISKKHEAFKAAFLHAPMHVICNMRSKQDYVLVEEKGKQVPKKVGMAPIQREGMEYEFTTVFDLNMANDAEVSKDRTGMFKEPFQITEDTGKMFLDWLSQATEEALPPPPKPPEQKQRAPAEKKTAPPAPPQEIEVYQPPPQPLTALEKMELGKFVISGGKFNGKKIGELDINDVMSYRNDLYAAYPEGGDPMPKRALDLLNRLNAFFQDHIY